MSLAVARGFAFSRVYRIVAALAQAKVTALPQEEEYSLETMFALLLAATANRLPEPDSHARSALVAVNGTTFLLRIGHKVPPLGPIQDQAFTLVFRKVATIHSVLFPPSLEARLANE